MGNEVVSTTAAGPADGPRDLAWLARNPRHSTTESFVDVAKAAGPEGVDQALAKLGGDLSPVPADGEIRRQWRNAMDERLRRLAVKVSPGMSPQQADPWRDVMADALSDLPAMVALTAAKRALHKPMQFMNEIEPAIRAIAAEIEAERREAIWRLERIKADMELIINPPVALPAPETPRLTADEIRSTPAWVLNLGLKVGDITQDEIDAALAAGDEQEAKAA